MDKLKYLGVGVVLGALLLWRLWRQRPAPSKQQVEAAVERFKADAVKAEPVPTDINEVRRDLKKRGLIK